MSTQCPQCNLIHPPLEQGAMCPMAKDTDASGNEIDTSNFITQLNTICVHQIKTKNIKDHKKMFGKILVSLTKQIQEYQE